MRRSITQAEEFEGIEDAMTVAGKRIRIIEAIIKEYPAVVKQYQSGDEQALAFLVDHVIGRAEGLDRKKATWMLREWLSPTNPDGLPKRP